MKPIAGFLPIAFCGASMCVAQQEKPRAFDAVLIQQSSARQSMITRIEGGPGTRDPGRFRVTEMNMSNLVSYASGISYRFIAGPSWMSEQRYDLTATMPPETTKDQFREMMKQLLVERFGLTWHIGKIETDGYKLTVEKNGLLLASDGHFEAASAEPGAKPVTDKDGFTGVPLHAGMNFAIAPGRIRVQMVGGSLKEFVNLLSGQMQQPVVDATGLPGAYDFTIIYTTDWLNGRPPSGKEHEFAPDVFTVLSKRLGLKLERTKVTVDQFVVDHLERTPTDN